MTHPLPTKKDFVSDQEVRWCPGCGDYAILAAIQKTMPELGIPRENIVFVSGIGCSSRFPYYMNTYGFHTIHGRAPSIATGLKIANPDLSVWVVTGDGDGLSIGGNHLIHVLRRNVDVKILLFNNEIYGLTKGQYSPTSARGTVSKSTPFGSIEQPFQPLSVALGSEATFVARVYDKNMKLMSDTFKKAAEHKGTAFIEIFQNCVIFNDDVFEPVIGKDVREDNVLELEHGKPLLFGKNKEKGIRFNGMNPEVVRVADAGLDSIHVHDETVENPAYAFLLARFHSPEFPTPMGVLRAVKKPVYEQDLVKMNEEITAQKGPGTLEKLLRSGDTWEIH